MAEKFRDDYLPTLAEVVAKKYSIAGGRSTHFFKHLAPHMTGEYKLMDVAPENGRYRVRAKNEVLDVEIEALVSPMEEPEAVARSLEKAMNDIAEWAWRS